MLLQEPRAGKARAVVHKQRPPADHCRPDILVGAGGTGAVLVSRAPPGLRLIPPSRPQGCRDLASGHLTQTSIRRCSSAASVLLVLQDHQLSLTRSQVHISSQGLLPSSSDSHKNRLQLPDKQLERLPLPNNRTEQNVTSVDTHKYKVFTLHTLSKLEKYPLPSTKLGVSPLLSVTLLQSSNPLLTYRDQKMHSSLRRSYTVSIVIKQNINLSTLRLCKVHIEHKPTAFLSLQAQTSSRPQLWLRNNLVKHAAVQNCHQR